MELLGSVIVLLVFLTLALTYAIYGQEQYRSAGNKFAGQIECEKTAQALSNAWGYGTGTWIQFATDYNIYIAQEWLYANKDGNALEGAGCRHNAIMGTSYSGTGTLTVENQNGIVYVN